MTYQPRIVDKELSLRLTASGAVVIEGPKGCGKTATARQVAESEVLLDVDANARRAVELDPRLVLDGPVPRLLDEWQVAPEIWNHIRRAVDDRGVPGQFILTGSARPTDDIIRHTGAARLARLRMRPMTLAETGHSIRTVSLGALLDGQSQTSAAPPLAFADVLERIVCGGWPGMQGLTLDQAIVAMRDYADELVRADVQQVAGKRVSKLKVASLLTSLARHVATTVSQSTLAADIGAKDTKRYSARRTVERYLDALERLMIVENQPAWAPHLRSRSRLREAPKRHLVDPALAAALLRATPPTLANDLNLTGLLFESMVVRDLRVYAQANDAEVFHYRDNTGLEVDAIVQRASGAWAAFEIKLGGESAIEEGAANLLTFAQGRIHRQKMGPPAALGVIVAQGLGIVRGDRVAVIPIGALAP